MYILCSQINIHAIAIPLEFVGIAIKIKFRKVIPNFLHIPDWFSEEGNFKEDVQDKVLFLIISSGPGPRLRTGSRHNLAIIRVSGSSLLANHF